ncbi:MAG: DUF4252 domain-containing protein [Odoribacter sp.]
MKQLFIILLAIVALPFYTQAQLSKLMSKYHEQNGVTVTQLDKSLYGLYQKSNLPPEAIEMLRKLDEVNILNLNLTTCEAGMENEVNTQFRAILDNPEQYKLIKSHRDDFGKQLIYSRSENGKTTDLVVMNRNPERLDLIELRGDIQLDKIALLSKALNLKGLHSLAALSSHPDFYQSFKHSNDYGFPPDSMLQLPSQIRQMDKSMRMPLSNGWGEMMMNMFGMFDDSTHKGDDFFNPFGEFDFPEELMGAQGAAERFLKDQGFGSEKVENYFQSFGDGENTSSSAVRITEENGKTKIKIDAKNADITYVIDGKNMPKDKVQMPEKILNVDIIPSRKEMKKSYLFVTSQNKIGSFVSFKDGMLIFNYENQEYKYNLDKATEPLLIVNGRLSTRFNVEPSTILQIRPVSSIEKEIGYYPKAEVMINTK